MNIWLLQASEPMPVVNPEQRLLRTGMMAEELNRRGHNVTWFSNSFYHYTKQQMCKKDKIVEVNPNYHIYLLHAMGYKKNISLSRIINHKVIALKFRKVSRNIKKPDLIYASFPTIEYVEEAVKYGKRNNVPVIVDIRDLWPDIFNHNLSGVVKLLAQPYIKLIDHKTKRIMKNAYAINSISEAMLEWGLKKGKRIKTEKDMYFYIGYDKKKNVDIEKKELIDKEKFNISFFATMNNQFDYDKIAKIAKLLKDKDKDVIINICGDGPQFDKLKDMAKDVDNIILFGWTERDKLSYILQNSKVGLAPYKNTFDFQMSVSNKFSEYLSYGLPIIMTSEGYMKELLEKNKCGKASTDVNELCDFVLKIKNDEKMYKEMSENANNLYEADFVSKKIYSKLSEYLENIIEKNKGGI